MLGCVGAVPSPVLSGFFEQRVNLRFWVSIEYISLNLHYIPVWCVGWTSQFVEFAYLKTSQIMFDFQEEELGSKEGLERSKEMAVCNKICFLYALDTWAGLTRPQLCSEELDVREWLPIGWKLLEAGYGPNIVIDWQVKNIQKEEFGGRAAANNGGEVRIQQVTIFWPQRIGSFLLSADISFPVGCGSF